MPELTDEGARSAIRERLRDTLFVDAGAGTGKTSELVRRIVNLVHRRAPDASIAFNRTPSDTFEAAARWLD